MEIIEFEDVEWVLARELAENLSTPSQAVHPYATSTDAELAVPSITVRQTGGHIHSVALSEPIFSVDVRATTEDEALRLARRALAVALAIGRAGLVRDGVVIVNMESTSVVFANPDPRNPLVPRATFVLVAVCKGSTTH